MAIQVAGTPRHSPYFVALVGLFVTCLITSNIIAVKLVDVRGAILPAGIVIFPLSYLFGDVLTEVYGYGQARLAIWLGFACNLVAVLAIWLAQILPPAPFWGGQAAYERILGAAPRLLAASFLAYLVGEFANAYVLAKMKMATQGRWLWTRTIGSTLVGQGLDSLVFIVLAFAGTIPTAALATAIVMQWVAKSLYETLATPFTYWVVGLLKRRDGVDVYDYDTNFNPLCLCRK
jgi:hypothetical protein